MALKSSVFSLLTLLFLAVLGCSKNETLPLIPVPDQLKMKSGFLRMEPGSDFIRIEKTDQFTNMEAYSLRIDPDEIVIRTSTEKGKINALNTLEQIKWMQRLQTHADSVLELPCLEITDHPAFQWRGLMLDCSRTFIPVKELRKYIDVLALYKMNVLHLHLTDDQGWRLEIKQYPGLTALCSEAAPKYANEKGGYYTQAEMKELIQYAAKKGITIVPEIEMPGHSSEVFRAFPELSCLGKRTEIFPFFSGPGVTPDIYCAGKESVFVFLENVLDEVCALFPSEYIHIGGDEAPKVRWDDCEDCQRRIQEEGLKDSHELQSYFIRRIEKMLNARGKTLLGWDEILEGGLAENAVVMSPTSHCYFDYSYGATPVDEVYDYNPVPDTLTDGEADYILGAQGNFWSHIDRQPYAMQRQIFPRIMALAEVLWSGAGGDYGDFEERLNKHYSLLDRLNISYYHPDKIIEPNDSTDFAAQLNLEGYVFDFHGYQGAEFNYQGMSCKVVLPEQPAAGHPWVWRARFWGHEPQFDLALLKRGYHVVYCDVGNLYGNPVAVDRWNRFYALMQKAGLAEKGILEGMSRGGLIIYNWALANPDKVSGIYADAPVLDGFSWPGGFGAGKGSAADWSRFKQAYEMVTLQDSLGFAGNPIHQAREIAQLGIPLIHVCGNADQVVPISENTDKFAQLIRESGGKIEVIRKPGVDHHPHSLADPAPIIDYLLEEK